MLFFLLFIGLVVWVYGLISSSRGSDMNSDVETDDDTSSYEFGDYDDDDFEKTLVVEKTYYLDENNEIKHEEIIYDHDLYELNNGFQKKR